MTDQFYWENGERVPVFDPRREVEEPDALDSPPLVMMRRLLSFMKATPNLGLSVECACLISGIHYKGLSIKKIAEENSVSRQTVYKRCHDMGEYFGACQEALGNDEFVLVRRLIGHLKQSPHPQMTADCLCLICGVCYDGSSMAGIAKSNFVSRATVSNRCVALCDAFGIEPTRAMRSRQARENCQKARFKKVSAIIR